MLYPNLYRSSCDRHRIRHQAITYINNSNAIKEYYKAILKDNSLSKRIYSSIYVLDMISMTFDGLDQKRRNSVAITTELRLLCNNPLT